MHIAVDRPVDYKPELALRQAAPGAVALGAPARLARRVIRCHTAHHTTHHTA